MSGGDFPRVCSPVGRAVARHVQWLWLTVACVLSAPGTHVLAIPPQSDPLPPSPISPEFMLNLDYHTAPVKWLAFATNENILRLYSAGNDKVVHVWKVSSGAPRKSLGLERIVHEKTFRWQVSPGPGGAIYSLAYNPNGDDCNGKTVGSLFIAGNSASLQRGAFIEIDSRNGDYLGGAPRKSDSPTYSILGLGCAPDGSWLASIDSCGRTFLWPKGRGASVSLPEPFCKPFGNLHLDEQKWPKQLSVCFAGNGRLIVPTLRTIRKDRGDNDRAIWGVTQFRLSLARRQASLERSYERNQDELWDAVLAVAASPDGRFCAASDDTGKLLLWDVETGGSITLHDNVPPTNWRARCLAFDAGGTQLVAGLGHCSGQGGGLEIWDLKKSSPDREQNAGNETKPAVGLREVIETEFPVNVCQINGDGRYLAYVGERGRSIHVKRLPYGPEEILAGGPHIACVRFNPLPDRDLHRVSFSCRDEEGREARHVFSPDQMLLTDDPQEVLARPAPRNWALGKIAITENLTGGTRTKKRTLEILKDGTRTGELKILKDGAVLGTITLDAIKQGSHRCHCWIPAKKTGEPCKLAIGTDGECGIFIYDLLQKDLPLTRYFRGHQGAVTTLDASPDGCGLVSGAMDGTVRFWWLGSENSPLRDAWGGSIEIREQQAVLTGLNRIGPFFQRGLRDGDAISQIEFRDAEGRTVRKKTGREILVYMSTLKDKDLLTSHVFNVQRPDPGGPRDIAVAVRPAWRYLAALYASEHTWVASTPDGYYMHSPGGGDRLAGWLYSISDNAERTKADPLAEKPVYYLAAQYHEPFFRPEHVRSILTQMEPLSPPRDPPVLPGRGPPGLPPPAQPPPAQPPPSPPPPDIADEPPKVEIVDVVPATRKDGTGRNEPVWQTKVAEVTITAEVTPQGRSSEIGKPELYLDRRDGPSWLRPEELHLQEFPGVLRSRVGVKRFSWKVSLAKGTHTVSVMAKTKNGAHSESPRVIIEHEPKEEKRTLYVLAIGVTEDGLKYAGDDALHVYDALTTYYPRKIFGDCKGQLLTDSAKSPRDAKTRARKPTVDEITAGFVTLGKTMGGDEHVCKRDCAVVFFAGHGTTDPAKSSLSLTAAGGVTFCADDLIKGLRDRLKGNGTLIVIMDACRSVPNKDAKRNRLPQQDRFHWGLHWELENDMNRVVVLTSCGEGEDSFEDDGTRFQAGVFSHALVNGLEGWADRSLDGVVDVQEIGDFAVWAVPELLKKYRIDKQHRQTPVFSLHGHNSSDQSTEPELTSNNQAKWHLNPKWEFINPALIQPLAGVSAKR